MKLSDSEMLYLMKVQEAGDNGLVWSPRKAVPASRLLQMGLIQLRMGPLSDTDRGRRTTMRFVAEVKNLSEADK